MRANDSRFSEPFFRTFFRTFFCKEHYAHANSINVQLQIQIVVSFGSIEPCSFIFEHGYAHRVDIGPVHICDMMSFSTHLNDIVCIILYYLVMLNHFSPHPPVKTDQAVRIQ